MIQLCRGAKAKKPSPLRASKGTHLNIDYHIGPNLDSPLERGAHALEMSNGIRVHYIIHLMISLRQWRLILVMS